MSDPAEFITDPQRDLERHIAGEVVFHPLTAEGDHALDRLFAMMKPHFEKALDDAVKSGRVRVDLWDGDE